MYMMQSTDLGRPVIEPGIELVNDHAVFADRVEADFIGLVDDLEEELAGHDGPEGCHDEARCCAVQHGRSQELVDESGGGGAALAGGGGSGDSSGSGRGRRFRLLVALGVE